LTVYLDTSVLAGFFIGSDAFAGRAKTLFDGIDDPPIVSDFVVAEFASVVARLVRMNGIIRDEARDTFALFDSWRAHSADSVEIAPADISAATAIIRRLDLNLRAPDAINLAVAERLGAAIATFDSRMADNARTLGITVAAA
jgi:predicted nucleic acid-binding protein